MALNARELRASIKGKVFRMKDGRNGMFPLTDKMALLLVLTLALGAPLASGCARGADQGKDTATSSQSGSSQDEASDEQQAASGDATEQEPVTWPDECVDRRGDITVYALCELTGKELSVLLEQQDYVWSSRDQMWLKGDGSAAFAVCDAAGTFMGKDQIAALDTAPAEAGASYRLVTSGYSNPRKAFDGLAGKVMTCEDIEYTDLGTVGVVQGADPAARLLVVASKGDGAMVVSVLSEGAIAGGRLEDLSGRPLGTTINEAFEALVGRELAAEE